MFEWMDDKFTRILFEEDGIEDVDETALETRTRTFERGGSKGKDSLDKVLVRLESALTGLSDGDFSLVIKKLRQAKRITKCETCKEDIERTVIDAGYVKKLCEIGGDDCDEGIDSLSGRIEGIYHEYGADGNGSDDDMDKKTIKELDKKVHRKLMFVSKNCGGCKDVKEQFGYLDVDMDSIEEIDVEDDHGSELADKFGVMSVPGFVLLDKKGKVLERDFENVIDYLTDI